MHSDFHHLNHLNAAILFVVFLFCCVFHLAIIFFFSVHPPMVVKVLLIWNVSGSKNNEGS